MNICLRENLNQVDLLSPSVNKITQQEYYAKQRGQINLDKLNAELITEGFTPMKTKPSSAHPIERQIYQQ